MKKIIATIFSGCLLLFSGPYTYADITRIDFSDGSYLYCFKKEEIKNMINIIEPHLKNNKKKLIPDSVVNIINVAGMIGCLASVTAGASMQISQMVQGQSSIAIFVGGGIGLAMGTCALIPDFINSRREKSFQYKTKRL